MPNIEVIDPPAAAEWDGFVQGHPQGVVYHLSGWRGVLEGAFRHIRGHYLVTRTEDGRLRAGLPCFVVRSRLVGNRLVCVPFATQCDPLAADRSDVAQLLEAANALARVQGCARIEIRARHVADVLRDAGCVARGAFRHHSLELSADPGAVWERLHRSSVRKTIRRAQRQGLRCERASTPEDLRAFYQVYTTTRKRNGLPAHPFSFFRGIWRILHPAACAEIRLLRQQGDVCGGILNLKFRDRVFAEHVGYTDAARASHPTHLLLWDSIRSACEEGYAVFDFGRTDASNKGLLEFKRRWGTVESDLPSMFFPPEAAPRSANQQKFPVARLVQHVIRRSPQPLADGISRLCYRHLG